MKTALYDRHVALGAKIVSFAEWEMPLYYRGVVVEHLAVREKVGLFDVSHMGRIEVSGPDAEKYLDFLSTNKIAGKVDGTAIYTVWCHEEGGCVDDVMIYRQNTDHFFVIVNASNRQKDLQHLLSYQGSYNVKIQDHFSNHGILALQGPQAEPLLESFFPQINQLKNMHFLEVSGSMIISKTGYTGAGGFEIYGPDAVIVEWWDKLLDRGESLGIQPVGLGARDTLRLEMGFALYGHELSDQIGPDESVAAWTIKEEKGDFLGKKYLEKHSQKRRPYGIKLIDPGIAREGCLIYKGDKKIGFVTSGSFSPTLNQSIALILSDLILHEGDVVNVQIRQNQCRAEVVKFPFFRKVL